MKTILSSLFFATLFIVAFSSCDKDKDEPGIKDGVVVKTAEASADFDLTTRKDWAFFIGGYTYNFTIEGNKLSAISARDSHFRFQYGETTGSTSFLLYPKDYGKGVRDEMVKKPIIENQSTKERFLNCDPLRAIFSGDVSENLKGAAFKHYNALLMFNVLDLPEDAEVLVKQLYDQTITPLQDEEDPTLYKAIIFPENEKPILVVNTNEKKYEVQIQRGAGSPRMNISSGLSNNTVVSFKAIINEDDQLIISDLDGKSNSSDWLELKNK